MLTMVWYMRRYGNSLGSESINFCRHCEMTSSIRSQVSRKKNYLHYKKLNIASGISFNIIIVQFNRIYSIITSDATRSNRGPGSNRKPIDSSYTAAHSNHSTGRATESTISTGTIAGSNGATANPTERQPNYGFPRTKSDFEHIAIG